MQIARFYFNLLIIFFLLFINSQIANAHVYSESGIAVDIPKKWKLVEDKNVMRRQLLTFSTGEFSLISLEAFPKNDTSKRKYNDLSLTEYFKYKLVPRITSSFSKDSYKMISAPINRGVYIGIKAQVEYFIPNLDNIEAEAYLLKLDNAKIIVTIFTEKKDLPNVAYAIEDFLTSIKYVGSDKATK